MMVQVKTLLWLIPVCVIVSMAISLPAVWLLSKVLGFTFDAQLATIVGLLSASGSGTIVSAVILIWREK